MKIIQKILWLLFSSSVISVAIAIPLKAFDDIDNVHLMSIVKPDLIRISIKSLLNAKESKDEQQVLSQSKQIPVISDIERIKRIAEILARVGEIIGSLPDIQPSSSFISDAEKRIARNDTESEVQRSSETTLSSTSVD